jgi:membrane protease YdiL (CAAX protease family)
MVKNKWNIIPFITGLVIYEIFFNGYIYKSLIIKTSPLILNLIFLFLTFLLLLYFFKNFFKLFKLNKFDYLKFKNINKYLFYYLLFIIFGYIVIYVFDGFIQTAFKLENQSKYLFDFLKMVKLSNWEIILYIGIFGPITEEILFRGLLLKSFERKIGTLPALILSSLIFSSLHSLNLFLEIFAVGIFLGLIYIFTDNIWLNIFVHIFNNTVGALVYIFKIPLPENLNIPMIIVGIVAFIGMFYFAKRILKRRKIKKEIKISNKERLHAFIYLIIFVISIFIASFFLPNLSKIMLFLMFFIFALVLFFVFFKKSFFKIITIFFIFILIVPLFLSKPQPKISFQNIPINIETGCNFFVYNEFLINHSKDGKIEVYKVNEDLSLKQILSRNSKSKYSHAWAIDKNKLKIVAGNKFYIFNIETIELIEEGKIEKKKKKKLRDISYNFTTYKVKKNKIFSYTNGNTYTLLLKENEKPAFNRKADIFRLNIFKTKAKKYSEIIRIAFYSNKMEKLNEYNYNGSYYGRDKDEKYHSTYFFIDGSQITFYDKYGKILWKDSSPKKISDYKVSHYNNDCIIGRGKKDFFLYYNHRFWFLNGVSTNLLPPIFVNQDDEFLITGYFNFLYTKLYIINLENNKIRKRIFIPAIFAGSDEKIYGKTYFTLLKFDCNKMKLQYYFSRIIWIDENKKVENEKKTKN